MIAKRIEIEKRTALEEQLRNQMKDQQQQQSSPSRGHNSSFNQQSNGRLNLPALPRADSTASFELVSPDTGWTGEAEPSRTQTSVAKPADQADPMLVQIDRVRHYIKQARAEHKYDEVNMLESNLRELEIEYFMQKQEPPVAQE